MRGTFHSRTTTSAWVSKSNIRPSESVIAANVPLGDSVSFSPFLGWSFKHVKGDAATYYCNNKCHKSFNMTFRREYRDDFRDCYSSICSFTTQMHAAKCKELSINDTISLAN